jgi:hypothetical protein
MEMKPFWLELDPPFLVNVVTGSRQLTAAAELDSVGSDGVPAAHDVSNAKIARPTMGNPAARILNM